MVLQYDSGSLIAKVSNGKRALVHGVRFGIEEGETLALIGETGAGKTMIALSIMRLLPDNVKQCGGEINFCDLDLLSTKSARKLLGNEIVYVPQSGSDYLNPVRKVRCQLYDSLKRLGLKGVDLKNACIENLRKAGFANPEEIAEEYSFQLSGGMAQRVTIALALCSDAKLLILDEATNGLDHNAKMSFIKEVGELFPHAAKLVITHDIQVARTCDRIVVLCGGRSVESGTAREVIEAPRHPYTQALISALVENGMRQTPVMRDKEGDCPFYAHCAYASEKCKSDIPVREDGAAKWRCVL